MRRRNGGDVGCEKKLGLRKLERENEENEERERNEKK